MWEGLSHGWLQNYSMEAAIRCQRRYNHSSWVFSAVVLGGVWFVGWGDPFCSTQIFVWFEEWNGLIHHHLIPHTHMMPQTKHPRLVPNLFIKFAIMWWSFILLYSFTPEPIISISASGMCIKKLHLRCWVCFHWYRLMYFLSVLLCGKSSLAKNHMPICTMAQL